MSHPNQLVVIAAVLDTTQLTLYKADGTTYPIPQGDPRITKILAVCQAGLKNLGDSVTVDISETNHYADFEKKTGGLVKLFRVAKSKVAEFFGKTEKAELANITLGVVPTAKDVPVMTAVVTKKIQPKDAAIADIMANATPVSSKAFVEPSLAEAEDEPDTVIAVVNNQVIPDVAKLKPQMAAAVLRPNASTKGLEAFMTRVAGVMSKRRHSVEDLMQFLSKGDLPIADDGSIVIYKILKRKPGSKNTFVDCHSQNVPQKVGSYVFMDESLVDPDRRQDCSNGLHVASRSYLNSFGGDVVVLAKVAPEDVIAVPQYNVNKMRVCGYHILALLSQETFLTLKANKPMTDNSTDQALLGQALSGNHVGILERVRITAAKGGGIVITEGDAAPQAVDKAAVRLEEALPENGYVAAPVDVKEVAKAVLKEKEANTLPTTGTEVLALQETMSATPPPAPAEAKPVKLSLKQLAAVTYQQMLGATSLDNKQQYAAELVNLKKLSKKSWDALGITSDLVPGILNIAAPALPAKGAIFTNEATIAKAEKKGVEGLLKARKTNADTVVPKARKERSDKGSKVGHVDVAAGFPKKAPPNDDKMLPSVNQHDLHFKALNGDKAAGTSLLTWQKSKKKGWVALGFPADTKEMLSKLLK